MSLEESLLTLAKKDLNELDKPGIFSKVLLERCGVKYPEDVHSFLFERRKEDLKDLLSMKFVLCNAPQLFELSNPYRDIFYTLLVPFKDRIYEIIQLFPGDLCFESINTWFVRISLLKPGDISSVESAKSNVMALLQYESPAMVLSKVLQEFAGGEYNIPDSLLGKGKDIPNQMDIGFIYVRACYIHLYEKLETEGEKGPVLICGDPGIGKSYFGLYVFCRLTCSQEKKRAIRFTLSGDWIEFDGEKFRSGHGWSSSNWRNEETWLLLDGNEKVEMLSKRSRVILFASSQKQNYHNFMKKRNALTYYMPEWSLREMEQLVNKVHDIDMVSSSPFIELVTRSQPPKSAMEEGPKDTNSKSTIADRSKSEEIAETPATDSSLTKEEFEETPTTISFRVEDSSLTKEEVGNNSNITPAEVVHSSLTKNEIHKRVLEIVKERYELVGGRIRDVLASGTTTEMLNEILRQAVRSLTFQELSNVIGVQAESSIPSIVYKVIPDENDPKIYRTGLCSEHCAQLIVEMMIRRRDATAAELFFVFYRSRDTKVACGNLFESICLRGLEDGLVFEYRSFDHKAPQRDRIPTELVYEYDYMPYDETNTGDSATVDQSTISQMQLDKQNLIVKVFDSKKNLMPILKHAYENDSQTNILLKPTFPHQELFDSLYFNASAKAIYFLQMTIAQTHSLNLQKLIEWKTDIEKDLKIKLNSTEFVFVVPKQHLFHTYGIRHLAVKGATADNLTEDLDKKTELIDIFLQKNPSVVFKVLGVDVTQIGHIGPPFKKAKGLKLQSLFLSKTLTI
jgi:hypothetical protein